MRNWHIPATAAIFGMAFLPLFVALSIYSTNQGYPTWPFAEAALGTLALAGLYSIISGLGALYTVRVVAREFGELNGGQNVTE